jgi:hypothetical protein
VRKSVGDALRVGKPSRNIHDLVRSGVVPLGISYRTSYRFGHPWRQVKWGWCEGEKKEIPTPPL